MIVQAIYPDLISNVPSSNTENLLLEIGLEFPSEILVQVVHPVSDGPNSSVAHIPLSFLPPVKISILLPHDYPLQSSPEFDYIQADWLFEDDILKSALLGSWQAGECILYSWIEFVRSGAILQESGLLSPTNLLRFVKNGHKRSNVLTNTTGFSAIRQSLCVKHSLIMTHAKSYLLSSPNHSPVQSA